MLLDADGERARAGLHGHAARACSTTPSVADTRVDLEPGDTLLLYTDGLTEAGAPQRTLTTADVAALLARVRGETAAQTAEGCLARALEAGGGGHPRRHRGARGAGPSSALDRRENSGEGIFDTGTMMRQTRSPRDSRLDAV